MLKKLYVNNFKCLVNFEIKFSNINLLLGANGSGKTTVFEVLHKLQKFILGEFETNGKYYQVSEIFHQQDLTRWQNSPVHKFELEIAGNGGTYLYVLEIEYPDNSFPRMRYEKLTFNKKLLFEFNIEQTFGEIPFARLFNDYSSTEGSMLTYFDFSRSGVGFVPERPDQQKLTLFKKLIANFFIVQINPFAMTTESRQEEKHPYRDMSNYAAWYSHLSQEFINQIFELTLELQKIIKGFNSFQNQKSGEARILSAIFNLPSKTSYKLNELSEGQKTLIALYTLLFCTPETDCILCIDEPENFLALPEIQPWLMKLFDYCQSNQKQALLISHHPSLINYLASNSGYWFERQENQPVRVQKIVQEDEDGLSIAKLIELRWIYDD
ncbi:MAG: AAA family ATPase [Okeania sp. SIO2F4]|uniref:AAA family ATPase n=1 Tax=Okeania sp. SIO2F4 TaxID=2607790 RepID=UPI00142AD9B5|nr:ATP-binding protein [Okeania sp. SIO2F4]NES04076.1 AAA family ATPase [Okeania sp. SIO2F4]